MISLLAIILTVLAFLIAATAFVSVIGPVMVLNPRRRGAQYYACQHLPVKPSDVGLESEAMLLTTDEGYRLYGWFIRAEGEAKGTILYLHGVGDNKMSGLMLAKLFHDHRFNVVMYDSRAHGESEGRHCTFGYYEKYDVQKAVDWIRNREEAEGMAPKKIGVFGTSMGAAVAVQAASIEPRLSAVVAEGCFTNLRTITVDYQKRLLRLPWHFLRNVAMKRAEGIAKFSHHAVSPLKAVPMVHAPILFIHGTADARIKHEYSETLFAAANEPKELFLVEEANHTDVHQIGKSRYEERIIGFFERTLAPSDSTPSLLG
ncbi:MAG: alpha/beta hydrolase [Acidobacteriota bacterium]